VPESHSSSPAPDHPSLAEATRVWARIGLTSFGGPAGQIALMHRELVEERRWISESRFLHALNYCMLLPGPEAQQLAIYVGWLLHGTLGGVVAGTLFVLPGLAVILSLATLYTTFHGTGWLAALFLGLESAVLAIVVEALSRLAARALKNRAMAALAALAFVALFAFHAPFPLVVLGAGLIGLVGARRAPDLFGAAATPADTTAVVDARLERQPHAPASLGRALGVIVLWGGLWGLPIVALAAIFGPDHTFVRLAEFFAKMAAVTFGGAYAALSYVAQQAVETFGWLAPGEMLDGLALAETTPGPLILVLSWVGFLAGSRTAPLPPLAGGLLGALVTTWMTFVPCFLWIFLGAPHVERLRGNAAFSGALAAIGAAVVGVIADLALWFALHVLFHEVGTLHAGPLALPWPSLASFDPAAAALALAAALMLFRLRLGVPVTLALCAALGFALRSAMALVG